MSRVRISPQLFPTLHYTALERSLSIPQLVNDYVYRSLMTESLSKEAFARLPDKGDFAICRQTDLDGKAGITDKGYIRPYDALSQLISPLEPFQNTEDIDHWYQNSADGIGRAFVLAHSYIRTSNKQTPQSCNIAWKYETAIIQLNQLMADSLTYLVAGECRPPAPLYCTCRKPICETCNQGRCNK